MYFLYNEDMNFGGWGQRKMLMDCVSPSNSHVGALTPRVTVFGDWAYTEVIKIK